LKKSIKTGIIINGQNPKTPLGGVMAIIPFDPAAKDDATINDDIDAILADTRLAARISAASGLPGPINPAHLKIAWRGITAKARYAWRVTWRMRPQPTTAEVAAELSVGAGGVRNLRSEAITYVARTLWALHTGFEGLPHVVLDALRNAGVTQPSDIADEAVQAHIASELHPRTIGQLLRWMERRGYGQYIGALEALRSVRPGERISVPPFDPDADDTDQFPADVQAIRDRPELVLRIIGASEVTGLPTVLSEEEVTGMWAQLTPERRYICRLLWFTDPGSRPSRMEIGDELELTGQRVGQLERASVRRMGLMLWALRTGFYSDPPLSRAVLSHLRDAGVASRSDLPRVINRLRAMNNFGTTGVAELMAWLRAHPDRS
jgi:hypothetical protein